MPQVSSKYECFLAALQAAVVVADIQHGAQHAAPAVDLILASHQTGLPAIIDKQTKATAEMVAEYVTYVWGAGDKPDWLQQAIG